MTTYANGPPTATLGTSEPIECRCTRRACVAPVTVVASASATLPAVAALTQCRSSCAATRPATLPTTTAATNRTSSLANTLLGLIARIAHVPPLRHAERGSGGEVPPPAATR